VGFGHVYVGADQDRVLEAMDRYLAERGFVRIEMSAERHPSKMKPFHENQMRLYWISPRLQAWTGIFEFRYYNNEVRERWGYADEHLALRLSHDLAVPVYRFEVMDTTGFWMYARYEGGEEKAHRIHEDRMFERPPDPSHPRYELNRLVDRESIRNAGLGYENIPGPTVCGIEGCTLWPKERIEGYEGFVHRAYEKTTSPPPQHRIS